LPKEQRLEESGRFFIG